MNTESRPDLLGSVIIVNRSRRDLLAQSLPALNQEKYANLEGIVLDGSTDSAVDLFRASGSLRLRLIDHRLAGTSGAYSEQGLFLIEGNHIWPAAKLFPWRVLIWNPLYFALRVPGTVAGALLGRGESARVVSSLGSFGFLNCVLRAHRAAITKLPARLRNRVSVECFPRLSPVEVAPTIRRLRTPLRDLVLGAR